MLYKILSQVGDFSYLTQCLSKVLICLKDNDHFFWSYLVFYVNFGGKGLEPEKRIRFAFHEGHLKCGEIKL